MGKKISQIHCENCPSKRKNLFCYLSSKGLHRTSENKTTRFYPKGEIVFHQGSSPEGIFCVLEGVLKLTTFKENRKSSIMKLVKKGDILDYQSLINKEYQASATVMEDAKLCFVDEFTTKKVLADEPEFLFHLIKQLSWETTQIDSKISSILNKTALERVIDTLRYLADNFGIEHDSKRIKINLILSRSELASLAKLTNETVIRSLASLKDQGLLSQDGKFLVVQKSLFFT